MICLLAVQSCKFVREQEFVDSAAFMLASKEVIATLRSNRGHRALLVDETVTNVAGEKSDKSFLYGWFGPALAKMLD